MQNTNKGLGTVMQQAYRRGRSHGIAWAICCQASAALEMGQEERAAELLQAAAEYSSPEYIREVIEHTPFLNLKTLINGN